MAKRDNSPVGEDSPYNTVGARIAVYVALAGAAAGSAALALRRRSQKAAAEADAARRPAAPGPLDPGASVKMGNTGHEFRDPDLSRGPNDRPAFATDTAPADAPRDARRPMAPGHRPLTPIEGEPGRAGLAR